MQSQPISQLFDLTGKAALVTGGAMGIGQAISLRLAEAGASVMIADIDTAGATVKEIETRGGRAEAIRTDVSITSDAQKAARATVEAFGSLDILVNNAGIYPLVPVMELTEEIWDRVLDINLKGAFFCSQYAAREMIGAGNGGKIINMGSLVSVHPWLNMAHYGISKAGLHMLTKSLALELAPHNILVNIVAPGVIVTPGAIAMASSGQLVENLASDESPNSFIKRTPLGRPGEPRDIAGVVLFLASSAADYMTGSLIMADGGYDLS